MAKAMLQSIDKDGTHRAPLQDVEILEQVGDNDYIVLTPAGIKCHALFNPFTGYFFADDVYHLCRWTAALLLPLVSPPSFRVVTYTLRS